MIKLFGIAIISSVVYLYVRKYTPEYALIVELAGIGVVLLAVIPNLKDVIDFFFYTSSYSDIDKSYVSIILKTVGIAFFSQFASDVCRDSGQSAMSSKIEFAGKVMMAVLAVPIAKALLETAFKMIGV